MPKSKHSKHKNIERVRACASTLMRRRRGSTHGYAHSEDLETGVRRSGAMDCRADGATMRALQPSPAPIALKLSRNVEPK